MNYHFNKGRDYNMFNNSPEKFIITNIVFHQYFNLK